MTMQMGAEPHDPVVVAQKIRGAARRVDYTMLNALFVGLMRCTTVFDEARRFVRHNQFDTGVEPHYQLLWRVLVGLRENHAKFNSAMIITELTRELQHNPGMMPKFYQESILREDGYGLVWASFKAPSEGINASYCRELLREFLLERTVASPLRTVMHTIGLGNYPEDLGDFLDVLTDQRDRITAINELPTEAPVPAPDSIMPPASIYHPTGLAFIDKTIGGQREGDVNGLLGVTGSGKSTLGAHLLAAGGRLESRKAAEEHRSPRLLAYFTYEENASKMYPRLWSAGFQIPRIKLETMRCPMTDLTNPATIEAYERKLEVVDEHPLSEIERWTLGFDWMNNTTRVFDMSGSGKFPHAGVGYIDEMVASLDTWGMDHGQYPKTCVVDYAGLCCRRHMYSNNIDDSRLRYYLARFGDECRHKIAERFHCTVWLLHQIAPSEAQKNATTLLHHSMAAEARAFAENLAACGCIGVPDSATGCRRLNWSKIRYSQSEGKAAVTLRIDDSFAMMVDVTPAFSVDEARRCFVSAATKNQVGGEGHTATAPSNGTPQPRSRNDPSAQLVNTLGR